MPVSKSTDTANLFLAACTREGFTVELGIAVSVVKTFPPGDLQAFSSCDMTGPGLLGMLSAKGGSQWGTDGGSMGGASAINHGRYKLNQTGVPLRVKAALHKILGK